MKKKLLSLVLATAMIFSLVACGGNSGAENNSSQNENQQEQSGDEQAAEDSTANEGTAEVNLDGSWPEETVKIGVEIFDATDEQTLLLIEYYESLKEFYNIDFMISESIASAEDEMAFVERCAAAGCKAVIGYYNITEAEVVQLCIDKGMYYWGSADKVSVYDTFKDNEYYLGAYDMGDADYEAGYILATEMIEAGCKKLVFVSGGRDMGIEMFIKRSEGFYAGVEEAKEAGKDVEVVYDVPGWPGTDAFAADQAAALDVEFDGLISAYDLLPWLQPIEAAGKSDTVKMAVLSNVGDKYVDYIGNQLAVMLYDNSEAVFGCAIPMILNAVSGHGEIGRTAEGYAGKVPVQRWIIDNADDYNAIYEDIMAGNAYISAEDIASVLGEFNTDATFEDLCTLYDTLTVEKAVSGN